MNDWEEVWLEGDHYGLEHPFVELIDELLQNIDDRREKAGKPLEWLGKSGIRSLVRAYQQSHCSNADADVFVEVDATASKVFDNGEPCYEEDVAQGYQDRDDQNYREENEDDENRQAERDADDTEQLGHLQSAGDSDVQNEVLE